MQLRKTLTALMVLAVGAAAQPVAAQQKAITLQASADAYVAEGLPYDNYGSQGRLRIGGVGDLGAGEHHGYVSFDFSEIPTGSTINSVALQAVQTDGATVDTGLSAYLAGGAWDESTLTWSNAPGVAGGAVFETGKLPGGESLGRVYSKLNDELIAVVQGWLDDASTNNGLVFKLNNPALSTGDTFAGSEDPSPSIFEHSYPFTLSVGYTEPGAATTPWLSQIAFRDASTGVYLASPSITRTPDGSLLATFEHGGPNRPTSPDGNIASVYRSTDDGASWTNIKNISGVYWSNVFTHEDDVYILGTNEGYGSLVIRRSSDNGFSWSSPTDASSGLLMPVQSDLAEPDVLRVHTAPTPVLIKDGRIYRAIENYATDEAWPSGYSSMVVSADLNGDLLNASNWTASNQVAFDPEWADLAGGQTRPGWLEGNVVEAPNGEIWNIMRVSTGPTVNTAAVLKLDHETMQLTFDPDTGFIDMPGAGSKFTIRRDPHTGKYLSLVNNNTDPDSPDQRNILSIVASENLIDWEVVETLLVDDFEQDWADSIENTGFQYADWIFDGEDISYVVRTSYDGADNFHNANRITYHRVEGYLDLLGGLPGDFNGDGRVDASDYTVWRDSLGQTGIEPYTLGDADGDGAVTNADYQIWISRYGASLEGAPGASGAIPEPDAIMTACLAIQIAACHLVRRAGTR